MKKKNLLFTFLLLTNLLAITGCSSIDSDAEYEPPEKVLERYFDALKNKDLDELKTVLEHENSMFNINSTQKYIDAIEEIELISYSEDKATLSKEHYMTMGRGTLTNPEEVKIFLVEYYIKFYEDESEGAGISGERTWNYILIRPDKNSPWVIDDYGPSLKSH